MKSRRPGDLAARRRSAVPAATVCSGVEPAGERLGGGQVALVGQGPDRLLAQPQRLHRVPAVRVVGRAVELQPQPGGVVELVPARRQVEHGHAVQAVGRDRRGCRAAAWPPSMTSRMCGVAGRSSAPNRGRSPRSGGSSAARSASDVDTIRIGPTASDCWRAQARAAAT